MRKSIFCLSFFCITTLLIVSACSFLPSREDDTTANLQQTITSLENQLQSQNQNETLEVLLENEPVITAAPVIAETPTDPYPPLILPFEDNFDNGLNSQWRIDFGQPIIIDGRLAPSGDELVIEIGNRDLKQYTLELDVWGKDPDYCGFGYFEYLTLNFSPTLRYSFAYTDYIGDGKWETYEEDDWNQVSRKSGFDCGRFRFVVNNSSYQLFINGQLSDELVYTEALGPLLISLDENVTIDNLSIK